MFYSFPSVITFQKLISVSVSQFIFSLCVFFLCQGRKEIGDLAVVVGWGMTCGESGGASDRLQLSLHVHTCFDSPVVRSRSWASSADTTHGHHPCCRWCRRLPSGARMIHSPLDISLDTWLVFTLNYISVINKFHKP